MTFYEKDHDDYREVVRQFVAASVAPHVDAWEEAGQIDRAVWGAATEQGITGLEIEERHGGIGMHDWRYRMVVAEELASAGATALNAAFAVHDDFVLPYLLDLADDDQQQRWLPPLAAGQAVAALAITEPGAGSDVAALRTTARRDGDGWVLDGQKTFISHGSQADLLVVAASTDPSAGGRGLSLFVVERGAPGLDRGRPLHKLGLRGQDTAEVYLTGCRVPATNLLGEVGGGFGAFLRHAPRGRLSIAVSAHAATRAALRWTEDHVFGRSVFGSRVGDLQNTRFVLAEVETELDVARAYLESCATRLAGGTLTAVEAAKAKWWTTELQVRATSRLLQLFGGYGCMEEYPIARAYRDCRVQTVYGGTTEVMKELIGRDIAARHR
ncbi:MAG: acyl-CoA dehydrogenase family protein [Actinobacteria bacterium]|nr:acyl-CoA dehydrogenase family protein [Actinomycetota bacterium]MCG2803328.1 acyl-CoA dehydrogenase family protein [Cellulomonas sp.]